ncbi:MAG: hypothetical protein FJ096_20835 [Deltaproteobacteria bacterium]|nr:hypothetical protein [Deltaproteobacteria bacterium]
MSEDARIHEPRWFPSRTAPSVAFLLTLPPLGALVTLVGAVKDGRLGIALVPVALVLVIYLGLLIPSEYGLDDDHVIVRSGLVRLRLPVASIRQVRSLRRDKRTGKAFEGLELCFGEGRFERIRIAPREHGRFLDQLGELTGLERLGDDLVARPSGDTTST